jgi:glutaredoxin
LSLSHGLVRRILGKVVLRDRLFLFVRFVLVLALASACVSFAAACNRKGEVVAEAVAEPPVVNDKTEGLQLTWIDEKGEFHIEQRVTDVPLVGRDVVRVRVLDPEHDVPTGDRVFVADLRNPKTDGNYSVRAVPRSEFEDVAVKRRSKNGTAVLAPQNAPSAVASANGNAPGASTNGNASDGTERPAVIIYGASWCGPCHQAAAHLKKRGVKFVEHDIEQDSSAQREMQAKLAKAGMRGGSIPVLDVRGRILVGFDARAVDQALGQPL